jgi:hypothetical protein
MRIARIIWAFTLVSVTTVSLAEEQDGIPRQVDAKVDQDDAVQGEYVGGITSEDRQSRKVGVQVVALGSGEFLAVRYAGGLPGACWDKGKKYLADGRRQGAAVRFNGNGFIAVLRDGVLDVVSFEGRSLGKLKRITRKSPTLGKKPPEDAIVLFDGTSADAFVKGRMTDDGLLMQGATSKQLFGSCQLHIEFRLPNEPHDRGQDRGNSGIFLQSRYEVQMLDSFGLEGKDNECGGIYSVRAPDVNMCLPPLQWQTYDIDFTKAQYEAGRLIANPRISVRHNGVLIHDDVELPGERSTTGAPLMPGPQPGPIYLQEIGNPVRYRNIWLEEKD